jgi:trk system potassium uptake protein TrkH
MGTNAREGAHLRARYRVILSHTGFVFALCSLLVLSPLVVLPVWPAEKALAWGFLVPAAVMAALGLALWRLLRPKAPVGLTFQEGGVVVLLSWAGACLFSAWPFMALSGLNFTQAVFEAVSGWTTTGLSVVDVTNASHAVLLWRSTMQVAGGAGLAIIMLSTLIGAVGPAVSAAEGREQLLPQVRESARLVVLIYGGYAIAGIVGLRIVGMTWFDAVNHSFAAVSTGGFSTRAENIGYWDSAAVEAVTIPLMILGNLSFLTAWALVRGRFRAVRGNGEVRLMALLIPLSAALLFMLTCRGLYPALGKAARVAVFETVTALTTTGFSTVGYGDWNSFGWLVLIVLMLIGGGTCSTAGGIKQYRVYMLWENLLWELRRWRLPRTAVVQHAVWESDRQVFVTDSRLRQIGTFVFMYLALYVIGVGVLAAHGYGLMESLFEYASSIGTVGISIGVTLPGSPPGVLWAETLGMFLGRLEFLVVFASVAKLVRDGIAMMRPARA